MSTSLSGDMGSELDRQAIEKSVVKLIKANVQFANAREFWALVAKEVGETYSITRGGNGCERIYRDIHSKNQTLPNDRDYIRASAADKKALREGSKWNDLFHNDPDKIYAELKDQQIAGAALAEAARANEQAATAEVTAAAKTEVSKGLVIGKGKKKE